MGTVKRKIDLEATSDEELVRMLRAGEWIECSGFSMGGDASIGEVTEVWVTNPYGVDCALLPTTVEGCQRLRGLVRWSETQEAEWA